MPPRRAVLIGVAVVAVAVVAIGLAFDRPRAAPPIAGMVRQTEIRIAPEVTGRLTAIAVQTGQQVRKGDLLAALAAARSDRDNVYSGMRAEEVAILAKAVDAAEATLVLARQEIARTSALA